MAKAGDLERELAAAEARLVEYRDGLDRFQSYARTARSGQDELTAWVLAARNLVNRAEAARFLLLDRLGRTGAGAAGEAGRILGELRALRRETEAATAAKIKPSRTAEMRSWMYDAVEAALLPAAGPASSGIGK